ncbi:Piso0_003449 [Millerozyma farinosa CBS 7064]|uniref:Piso0_003449 protein n=1 Tax=Pichia sorbitophila (strain ATCC MYA-4447 / BCRC 22081 / CBS 7064 / NBRC 10061 / NRRL Y-12695) TaxID=559304 RepID=G8YI47_PICSO|nr:Piso0_003449 [Millerozyma farinosa CBS 7064]CCE81099.1 Piso0_003449 [Millerozyma farinosa CBS 7064]
MSQIADKVTGKKVFQSKVLKHITSYKIIRESKDYALSYGAVNYVYQQLFSVVNYINIQLSSVGVLYDTATYVDELVDTVILQRLDWLFSKLPRVDTVNPVTYYNRSTAYVSSRVLRPLNNAVYKTGDRFLPATLSENRVVYKLEESTEKSEISKFFHIINEFVSRGKQQLSSTSNQISNKIISSYNKELDSLNKESSMYKKRALAAYNSGVNIARDINKEYIQPLKSHTQEYVSDVANTTKVRADSLISDAKNGITTFNQQATNTLNRAKNEGAELVNGGSKASPAPVVSASA